jgi:hypothetical protein
LRSGRAVGLRIEDIEDLEREPAAATKTTEDILRGQLAENGATDAEIDILIDERVELNAMASDDLIEMIERKLGDYGIEKVVPDDGLLAEAYQAFHRSRRLQDIFEEAQSEFDETEDEVDVPNDLKEQVREILKKHNDLRWDDAVQVALDETQLDHVRGEKKKRKDKAGDFVDTDDEAQP